MCSSRGLCGDSERASRSSDSGNSGSHYALCALGVGLIALGIVMIVWTVVPLAIEASETTPSPGNSTTPVDDDGETEENKLDGKNTSSVALVLVGAGVAMLLLSICLGVRNKRRQQERRQQTAAAAAARAPLTDLTGDLEEAQENPAAAYGVPSYEEAVGSGQYPVRESNLRNSISQLPSYEDIIAAVENEGAEEAANDGTGDTPAVESATSPTSPAADEALNGASSPPAAATSAACASPTPSLPTRSSSRASRILRPLRIRRIKSDKLHLKDFRLHIRSPTQNPVTIEPITPPPQYDDKMPELS